jgi:SAM-dependent methyltransferase
MWKRGDRLEQYERVMPGTTDELPEIAGQDNHRSSTIGDVASYTFGDDGPAVERLRLVASAYDPISRAFLAAHVPPSTDVAIDLGCGPGFSTQLLQEVCAPHTLIGVDSSSRFLEVARARLPGAVFEMHDVTATPLPGAPARVIYARLVLAHIPDPLGTVDRWKGQLASDGLLLVEDLEDIYAPPGPLREYDEVSADIVRRGGGLMYAGPVLAPLGGRCLPVTVPAALAARIYLFNVRRWISDPANATGHLRPLEASLTAVAANDQGGTVSWIVRQTAVRG